MIIKFRVLTANIKTKAGIQFDRSSTKVNVTVTKSSKRFQLIVCLVLQCSVLMYTKIIKGQRGWERASRTKGKVTVIRKK